MRRELRAVAVLVLLAGCSGSEGSGTADRASGTTTTQAAPAEERIETHVVALPDSVVGPRFPWWTSDGDRLLFSATPEGSDRVEVLTVQPEGSDVRCLTCGVAPDVGEPLLKPIPFADGRRVAVRVGNQNPLRAADHAILECSPSVARCDDAELVPLVPPAADDATVTQDQRELRLAPDGEHIGLSQVRTSRSGEATLIATVGRLRRTANAYEVGDARVVSRRGELKSFTPDGQRVLVAEFTPGPFETANPDVVSIDLATGDVERVTYAPDYDEPVEYAPDGASYAVGSGRSSGLFGTVAQVRRPSLLGTALDPLTAYLFARHRPELLEGWVVPTGVEADGGLGQPIPSPGGGYDGRPIYNWRPDGTAIAYWEGRGGGFETEPTDTRLVVAELPDREPSERPESGAVPSPTWAPPLAGFVPEALDPPVSRSGRVQGSVTVEVTERDGGQDVEVTYDGFADEAGWIVDGTERAERRGDRTTYTADLVLSGDHEGSLRADAVISVGAIDGTITSEVDGHRLVLPPPDDGG